MEKDNISVPVSFIFDEDNNKVVYDVDTMRDDFETKLKSLNKEITNVA